jgi:UMF1 family MFS transporter
MRNELRSLPTSMRSRIVSWALWDCGAVGSNAIVVTFVFSVYLTGKVGKDLPGDRSAASWLGIALAGAGLVIASMAPVVGVWIEAPRRQREGLAALTVLTVALTGAMGFIKDRPSYFLAGVVLLAVAAACHDLAFIPYNAMMRQFSTPEISGRVSGVGWAAGYVGSVVLLLSVYSGFIAGKGEFRGLLHISTRDGSNVRAAMLLAAAWFALFAAPLLITAYRMKERQEAYPKIGVLSGYRQLRREFAAEWRRDRNMVYFLVASAIFRDGLVGVFTFGAVVGVAAYGMTQASVLMFGIAGSLVAALGAVLGGLFDDKLGSKPVIVGSLTAIIALCLTMMCLSGPSAFWTCGLLLAIFIGPAQSSARTLLLQMSRRGGEGVAFGLYTMTGRAVSFVAPCLFSLFVDVFHTDRAGMAGLSAVLVVGLVAMLMVRAPRRSAEGTSRKA